MRRASPLLCRDCQRVRAAGGFDQHVRPDHSRLDMHRRHLRQGDADFVAAEPRPLRRMTPCRSLDDVGKENSPASTGSP